MPGNATFVSLSSTLSVFLQEEPTWSALRDDFVMGAQTMKDWDKEGEGSAADEEEEEDLNTDSEGD